jgi:ABC-2 type transport system ATP-binding protein
VGVTRGKRQVGVVPEDLALFEHLSAAETLEFVGQVHGLDRKTLAARSDELLSLMELVEAKGQLVADYSHGMRKKTSLAAALLPAPKLLFLDEPFEGIDAIASRQIKDLLLQFVGRGGTVFLTSHILEVVERLCDHVGVIHRGHLVAQGPIDTLRDATAGRETLEAMFLRLVGATDGAGTQLEWLSG